ncbi:MAG: ZIP zinc transporter [Nitrospirae bacterium GWC2_56_14]|nr:MAG: ZIP zinc transporter [Nitrospirae bacterium GWC2_56_14]
MLLTWIVVFSLLGSVGSLAGALLLLAFPSRMRSTVVPALVSYSAGTLLGAAFLGMLPQALERAYAGPVLATVLAGIVLFFLLEKLVIWRHCHDGECERHNTAGPLILFGDAFHNFVDGVVIAAAFLISIPLGTATALAVIAHEVPQEIGDFAVLLDSGYPRQRAFLYNLYSSLATLPGAMIAYFYLTTVQAAVPYILAFSAASFIYIATADLIPKLHRNAGLGASIEQIFLLLAGIGTILFFRLHQG